MKVKFGSILLTLLFLLFLSSASMATSVSFGINAGDWAYETGWSITEDSGPWMAGMATGTMNDYVLYSFDWGLDPGGYLLTMTDSYGDGLDGGGSVSLIVDELPILYETGSFFSRSYSLPFDVPETNGSVPEPATIFLFGSGLFGLVWYGRKRKHV